MLYSAISDLYHPMERSYDALVEKENRSHSRPHQYIIVDMSHWHISADAAVRSG